MDARRAGDVRVHPRPRRRRRFLQARDVQRIGWGQVVWGRPELLGPGPAPGVNEHDVSRLTRTTVVVPCHNEATRLDAEAFLRLASDGGLDLVFVDDGSTDDTACVLGELALLYPDHVRLVGLDENRGKGEAVRWGMRFALEHGAPIVGYYDADMATPAAELLRLVEIIEGYSGLSVVMASRVRLLGYDVRRPALRHYLGRLFATASGFALSIPVYDTQCGAKLFRRSATLKAAVEDPFVSRWAFDVELLSRLASGSAGVPGLPADSFLEVPLRAWKHVGGSKLGSGAALRAAIDLLAIARRARASRLGAQSTVDIRGATSAADTSPLVPVPLSEDAA